MFENSRNYEQKSLLINKQSAAQVNQVLRVGHFTISFKLKKK